MRKILLALTIVSLTVAACKTSKKTTKNDEATADALVSDFEEAEYALDTNAIEYDEGWEVTPPEEEPEVPYKASRTRTIDIIHTKLDVKFDYEKQHMYGKAYITLKPYFYPVSDITLDAKGFEILGVFIMDAKSNTTPLEYQYSDLAHLNVKLGQEYKSNQEITLFVNYVAKPNELPNSEGDFFDPNAAIKEDKGLYFINPTFEDKNKPRQIWTQGETESASCWFPTFDSPNERMTQEIIMTVDTQYVTLSNGKLITSKVNRDGTRTDHWKQNLAHAPYLAMMAVGEFAVVKDKWRNIEVNYYVEKEYAKYARLIFGNTPKMIEFYSQKLGVDYPWEKYHQIVVRDFVSGAMENTGAVVHFDRLQHDARTHIDEPLEEIVAHELFHHWFGDLATIESWANLPLNESFATYGEYLWTEYAYGRDEADGNLYKYLRTYLGEAEEKQVPLVRFHHEKPDDMFDAHSYQKGGHVLHMLRKYVGDDAFFKSLNLYLTQNKYKSVEMHQLRLAFEEVTGEDLNWFFNQWFYSAGHPVLNIEHSYNADAGIYSIEVYQQQYGKDIPTVFRLPVKVDLYFADGTKRTEDVVVDESYEKLDFFVDSKPSWVNFDAEKMLLCQKTETKPEQDWLAQMGGPLFLDKVEALDHAGDLENRTTTNDIVRSAIGDKFWGIRYRGLKAIKDLELLNEEPTYERRIAYMAENDKKSTVRSSALDIISSTQKAEYAPLYTKLLTDSSYYVAGEAITSLAQVDSMAAVNFAESNYLKENNQMKAVFLYILGKYGSQNYMNWFEKAFEEQNGELMFLVTSGLGAHMMNGDENRVLKGLELLESDKNASNWFMMFVMYGIKKDINQKYTPIYNNLVDKQNSLLPSETKKLETIVQILTKTGGLESEEEGSNEDH